MKPFFGQQSEVILLIFGFRTVLEKNSLRSYPFRTCHAQRNAFRVGILYPKDKKRANIQQNKATSPLTVSKGNRKIFITIRDGKNMTPPFMRTIFTLCSCAREAGLYLSNQACYWSGSWHVGGGGDSRVRKGKRFLASRLATLLSKNLWKHHWSQNS